MRKGLFNNIRVIDRLGRIGGIFINETAARHFVHEEIGGPVDAIEVDRTVAVLDPFLLSAA